MLDRDMSTGLRGAVGAVFLALAVGLTGCTDEILDVQDPDVVTPDQLQGPAGVPNKVAGMINDFREAYDSYVLYSGLLTDEFLLAGTFPTRLEIDARRPNPNNGTIEGDIYTPLHVSVSTAGDNDSLFTAALDDEAFSDIQGEVREGIALARLFGGYDRIFLGELFCQSILGGPEGESSPKAPAARMEEAITVLESAIPAAQDADLTSSPTDVATAARIGQARAMMFLGRYQEAAGMVTDVPDDFMFSMDYSANTPPEENEVFGFNWGVGPAIRWTVGNGNDASRDNERYPYYDEWASQNLLIPPAAHERQAFGSPDRPVSIETVYGGPNVAAPNGKATSIPLATGWEARMIEAEAMLRNGQVQAAEDMVNEMLETPSVNPLLLTEPALSTAGTTDSVFGEFDPVDFGDSFEPANDLPQMARARAAGLWLQGQRQGALRRYFRNDGVNLFPEREGNAMSLPVVQQEIDNNPNISQACPGGNVPGQG